MGVGGMALAWLLGQEKLLANPATIPQAQQTFDTRPKTPPHDPQAKAMISLFMHGGPSHVDLFDPKPELTRLSGPDYTGEIQHSFINRATKQLMGSPWKFQKHGECGTELSELLPHTAAIVDDICLIRSMHTDINGHEPSIWFMNTGKAQPGRPALGSWLTYALGSESQELPAYVVLRDPGGLPVDGVRNWSNGWMPPLYQGTVIRPQEPRILNLDPPPHLKGDLQQQNLALLDKLNRQHLERHPGEADLEARIASYELAAKMQVAAKEALDISGESEATQKLYGLDQDATREYGKRCLIARRLVERGVRVVSISVGGRRGWDQHGKLRAGLKHNAAVVDQPIAALLKDLRERGLLDSTLVLWGGEFGRTPTCENATETDGRAHHPRGYTMWLAGGGVKPGFTYGKTDELGAKIAENKVHIHDLHATIMHLLGIDH
ncbi:MAG: DUF1501 domain-containing protein, partial [Planctomycetales bacterium]|nr:DUF1501 domain-containing protein [Planctomycetales bacterium]